MLAPLIVTAIIRSEDRGFVAMCPEFDICTQGDTVEDARANLREALELVFESAHPEEFNRRLSNEVYVTQLEVSVG
jgi:predicted RNase H-like HicB family nuclease